MTPLTRFPNEDEDKTTEELEEEEDGFDIYNGNIPYDSICFMNI